MSTAPPRFPPDPSPSPALAAEMGLSAPEWEQVKKVLGREPTYPELGVFSVMWSEHCSYKSSRIHLGRLPTDGPTVVQGPGENAGAVDLGDGYCAVFKMESHNHPSFIEPYQGAATGVGGILRDVFTMGARPVATLNSLRFGRPDHPRTPELLRGVVSGIAGYGNCIGVPTVGGEIQFDKSYDGNILVNAFTVGLARQDGLFYGRASGLGNPVIYVGARTGRDGIHGATMASADFDDQSEKKLPTVQVGDPFMEKLLLEACLEIFALDCLEGVQDMGAAGLTSSSVEMAARAGTGIELELDQIPRRAYGLSPYELLLSESQERMLMVAKSGRENEVFSVCEKWGLDAMVVGRVTDTGRFRCSATAGYDPLTHTPPPETPERVVDIPIAALTDQAPKYDRPQQPPRPTTRPRRVSMAEARVDDVDAAQELLQLLAHPNIGSRDWVWRQYDHIVRNGTIVGPGEADAAVIRLFCEDQTKVIAIAVDCNGRQVQLDPEAGAAMAVAECTRNLTCTGAQPLGITDCLNFGNPEKPETMWHFAKAVDGIRQACLALEVPVVSGNVSFYNETEGRPILPTPSIAAVGQLSNVEERLTSGFRRPGAVVAHLGPPSRGHLEGSEWFLQRTGKLGEQSPGIDLEAEASLQRAMVALARGRLLDSAHDASDGGLAVCLAECCLAQRMGARVRLPGGAHVPPPALLFSEEPSRVVVSLEASQRTVVETVCREHGVPFLEIGRVEGESLSIDGHLEVAVDALADAHASALDGVVGEAQS